MTSDLSTLLELRRVVGFLGERAQFCWWPTAFYEVSSHQFLEPVFAKTTRLAQYHGVVEAARRLHDEHLSAGSFHLFRLPEEIEQDLHNLLQSTARDELSQLPRGKDAALEVLKQLSPSSSRVSEGPIAVGSVKDINSPQVLGAIASAYVWAFSRNAKTYPYLVG
jgi:hypothetical protein